MILIMFYDWFVFVFKPPLFRRLVCCVVFYDLLLPGCDVMIDLPKKKKVRTFGLPLFWFRKNFLKNFLNSS